MSGISITSGTETAWINVNHEFTNRVKSFRLPLCSIFTHAIPVQEIDDDPGTTASFIMDMLHEDGLIPRFSAVAFITFDWSTNCLVIGVTSSDFEPVPPGEMCPSELYIPSSEIVS